MKVPIPPTRIEHAVVTGIKADFVRQQVKITLAMGLTEGLLVRQQLSELASAERPVKVEIRPIQARLPMLDMPDGTELAGATVSQTEAQGEPEPPTEA